MKARRGFTMIEILVVIGILVILMVILVVALGGLSDTNRERQTKTLLQNLRSMIAEMEVATGGLNKQPAVMYYQGSPINYNPTAQNFDVWRYYQWPGTGTPPNAGNHYYGIFPNTSNRFGPVTPEHTAGRYQSDPVLNTQKALEILEAVPANKAALAGLPGERRMEGPPAGLTSNVLANQPRLVIDGWNNPIILVPAAGMEVTANLPDGKVGTKLVRSPDRRPFWASAGPDGFFTDPNAAPGNTNMKAYGEDNVYSFEN